MRYIIRKDFPVHPFQRHWQFCVGSGHAALALRADYCRQLKRVHEELGIRYVRFHGIFNDDMKTSSTFLDVLPIPGTERYKERTFHRCGIVFDNVLDCGMKPFVELSFMPECLALEPEHGKNFYGSIMSKPADYELWAEYIRDFTVFLLNRYGRAEVESWYFEVWNEPDLTGFFFKGTKEDYFRLYAVTARAIKAILPTIKVGGPATSGSRWIRDFIEYCDRESVPVDFVSTHQYAGEPFLGVEEEQACDNTIAKPQEEDALAGMKAKMQQWAEKMETLPEDAGLLTVLRTFSGDPSEDGTMGRDVMILNAPVVKKQAKGLPVFYTEWNFCATFGAYSNDTRKAAAYNLRTALHTESLIDGSGIWCFSDIFEELHQFTEEFHGGFGMQTLNGVPKPVFYAMKLLTMAEESRIELGDYENKEEGETELAAFTGEREMQVLLYRQSMKQYPAEQETAEIEVEIDRKPKQVIMYRIDEAHCNPLGEWEKCGRPHDLTRSQVLELEEKTRLVEEDIPCRYQDGILRFEVSLGINDICFVRMIR